MIDECGTPLDHAVLHVVGKHDKRQAAAVKLAELVRTHACSVIAIGNGAAARETENLVAEVVAGSLADLDVGYAIVNEAGASVYSTSVYGREELPGHEAAIRGAISIGRRLQDPLSELVKIEPANIGVGPPPPSSIAVVSRAPASVPPPPMHKTRPALDPVAAIDIPPLPRVAAELVAPPATVPRAAPWRVVHLQNDGTEKTAATFDATVEIGRKGTAALADDPFVSPRHARLTLAEGGVRIEDLGSLNGVFQRIAPHAPVTLASGDVLLVGAQVLRVEVLEGAALPGAVQGETNVFGGPAKPRLARLVEVTCDGAPRSSYVIGSESVVIGRESADIVYADDPHLSRRHAEVRVVGGHAAVVDLGSSNGTYLRVRGEAVVGSGAQLRVGQQRLRVERLENRGGA